MSYEPQFFRDVTEIRKDMTGVTGSGELVMQFEGEESFRTGEEYKEFADHVQKIVKHLNCIEGYEWKAPRKRPV